MRGRNAKSLMALNLLAVLGGCRTFTPPARVLDVPGSNVQVVDYESTRRGTYVVTTRDGTRIAAEPPPDAALGVVADLSAKLQVPQGAQGEAAVKIQESIVKLAERTQIVIVYRDLMYRLAEMYASGAIDRQQYDCLYREVLEVGIKLADATRDQAQAELTRQTAALAESAKGLAPEFQMMLFERANVPPTTSPSQ